MAAEEKGSEMVFEEPDLPADRAARDVEFLGSADAPPVARGGLEGAEGVGGGRLWRRGRVRVWTED